MAEKRLDNRYKFSDQNETAHATRVFGWVAKVKSGLGVC